MGIAMRRLLVSVAMIAFASSVYAQDAAKREPAMGAVLPPPVKEAAAVLQKNADRHDAAKAAMNPTPKPAPAKPPKPAPANPPKPTNGAGTSSK